ncbi:MAG: MBL fold metallo-hydrolase [Lachnospiraceae bacterium]|nr:MBL fold metallo-hydrolase [Lachnospiraceae bacterium]
MANIITVTNVLGALATNCYMAVNTDTRETLIIDPADKADFIIKRCKEQHYKVAGILLTHGHFDHIRAVPGLKKEYPDIKIYAGKEEEDVLKNVHVNMTVDFPPEMTLDADIYVDDGEELDLIGTKIKCLHVPGHTKGGMCYYFEENKIVFSGDTLFEMSVGRSDFPTGSWEDLIENISKKLLTLPDDVVVYSGHGGKTTIGREKMMNPFFSDL